MNKGIILAAGKGTRMKSNQGKVLHAINGKAMIRYVTDLLKDLGVAQQILIVGHQRQQVADYMGEDFHYAVQEEQLGTGHAVMMAKQVLDPEEAGLILVVCGDTPLLTKETLAQLMERHKAEGATATVLSCEFPDPTGYGRILRDEQNQVAGIVEEKDADGDQKLITEINSGTYCFDGPELWRALDQVKPANSQGEYYLTDVIHILAAAKKKVMAYKIDRQEEIMGINNKVQLAEAAKILRQRKLVQLMEDGVTIVDPATTYVEDQVEVGTDAIIYPNTYLMGATVIGAQAVIGPNAKITDSRIGSHTTLDQSTVVESQVGEHCVIGPYAYLRPGTILKAGVKIGDFVEIKNSEIGQDSKVPHLSYIGDSLIGAQVNIGAGTITCNYDGINKHRTTVEDGVFIGSNTNLVAPVVVGEGAIIGAGSTITKDVPAKALGLERGQQIIIKNYVEKRGISNK